MVAASVVVVGDEDRLSAAEMLGKGFVPLTAAVAVRGAPEVGGCSDALPSQRVTILLALDDENPTVGRDGLNQLGQPVGHSADAFHVPDPAILHVVRYIVSASL